MEVNDSFTYKLQKRTEARRDYLKVKMLDNSARKNRTALIEEKQIPDKDNKEHKKSPKYFYTEKVALEHDAKGEEDFMEKVKENVKVEHREIKDPMKKYEPVEETTPLRPRGLAALRKKKFVYSQDYLNEAKISQDTQQVVKPPTYVFSTHSKELCSTRSRLAHLAAKINGWEDDLPQPVSPDTSSAKEPPAATAKKVEDTFNESFEPSKLPMSERKALFEKAAMENKMQAEKQAFKPKVSVIQQAAIFENTSDNIFRFGTSYQKSINASSIKPSIKVGSPAKGNVALPPAKSSILKKSPAKPSPTLTRSHVKFSPISCLNSPVKSSAFCHNSPAKSSPAFCHNSPVKSSGFSHDSPAKHGRNVGSTTFPSTSQEQWTEVAGMEPEKMQPLTRLVDHWEKLSLPPTVTNSQSKEKILTAKEEASYTLEDESECEEEQVESGHEERAESEYEESKSSKEYGDNDDNFTDISSFNSKKFRAAAGIDTETEKSGDDDNNFTDISSFNSTKFRIAAGINTETESEDINSLSDHDFATDGDSCYPSQSLSSRFYGATGRKHRSNPQPLLHSVSAYRKLIKESRHPPSKHEASLTEKEQKRIIDMQETIKHLQEEVVRQQNRIGQSSKLINWLVVSKPNFRGSTEEVEAEKLLLIATQKHQACLNEIQQMNSQGDIIENGYGALTVTNIKLPLKRDFIRAQLEGKNDDIHYFLCLVRYGAQVMETQIVSTNDEIPEDILHFTNVIKLKNLPPGFSVVFEVFALQSKKENLSHDKKYSNRRDYSKTKPMLKKKNGDGKYPAVNSELESHAVRFPSFKMVGYTHLTLQNCTEKCFTLDKVPFNSPLQGLLKVKLQLHAEHNVSEKGFLTMFEDVSGFGAWHRRWCSLENHLLSYWKYPDDEHKKDPMGAIDLRQCITKEVCLVSRDICARPHTFQLVEVRPRRKGDRDTLISQSHDILTTTKCLLSADTKKERERWCQRLNDALRCIRLWNPKALAAKR